MATETEKTDSSSNSRRAVGIMSDSPPEIPVLDKNFVPYGSYYEEFSTIVASGRFSPVMVTGLSGNGKTKTIEQVCANLGKPLCRINITCETDEDDLIGGFRLIDGETVFNYGPVVEAMHHGALLLLDEIDLASDKIMILQSVLEGNPIFVKRIGRKIYPKAGFNIVATANTKGQGNESGKFVGTRVMNEAFLDRYAFMIEHEYPEPAIEQKILETKMANSGLVIDDFPQCLVKWAKSNREAFANGIVDDVITTRRLLQVIEAYIIFGSRKDARAFSVKKCLARFNKETQESLFKAYQAIDENAMSIAQQQRKEELSKKTKKIPVWNPTV